MKKYTNDIPTETTSSTTTTRPNPPPPPPPPPPSPPPAPVYPIIIKLGNDKKDDDDDDDIWSWFGFRTLTTPPDVNVRGNHAPNTQNHELDKILEVKPKKYMPLNVYREGPPGIEPLNKRQSLTGRGSSLHDTENLPVPLSAGNNNNNNFNNSFSYTYI